MIKMLFKMLLHSMPNPRNALDLAQLKMSFLYIKSVKTFRLLFVSLLGIGICLVFLSASLMVFHVSLFLSPLSEVAKMWIGFGCAAVYFGIAFEIFSRIFSQRRWMKIFHIDEESQERQEAEVQKEEMSHV
jgi:hypothetical protein